MNIKTHNKCLLDHRQPFHFQLLEKSTIQVIVAVVCINECSFREILIIELAICALLPRM